MTEVSAPEDSCPKALLHRKKFTGSPSGGCWLSGTTASPAASSNGAWLVSLQECAASTLALPLFYAVTRENSHSCSRFRTTSIPESHSGTDFPPFRVRPYSHRRAREVLPRDENRISVLAQQRTRDLPERP